MSLALTNWAMWPLIALVAVPLILHLFARTRPPVYRFSSIEFILRIIRSTMRIKRPQDWILLAVRTLLFAAVVLVFLRPLFFSQHKLAGLFQRKNVVLLVDATASMAYVDGAQTRFAAACAEASEILGGLSSRDAANVIWLDSAPDAVFPELGANIGYLRDSLRRASVTSEAGGIEEAFELAVKMLAETEGRREICVISDFQKSAWGDVSIVPPQGVDMVMVPVAAGPAANAAVTDIQCNPSRPLAGEEVTVYCDVHNYSSQPCGRTLFLKAHDSRQSQHLMIPAWGKATAVFKRRFSAPGVFCVAASLDEDAFPWDDRRWTLVNVVEFMRTGILAAEPGTGNAWRRALDALGWAKTETLAPPDLAGDLPYDILMLSGWDGTAKVNLLNRLTEGATVVCYPADGLSMEDALLSENGSPPVPAPVRLEQSSEPRRVKIVAPDDAAFRLFAEGEYGDPSRGLFRARLRLPSSALPPDSVLMAYDDGVPALARVKRNGTLFLWNLPLDPDLSNWAAQVEFLPFLAEMLLRSRPARAEGVFTEHLPGEPAVWRPDRAVLADDVALQGDDGRSVAIRQLQSEGRAAFASVLPPPAGPYTWRHRKLPVGYSVVNFPTVESDLRTLSRSQMRSSGSVVATRGSKVRRLRDGMNLWPYLLAGALGLALLEGAALLWMERT